jgi:hypothetical protein
MQRRFGPVLGAGTVLIEEDGEKQIQPSTFGVTGWVGILEKGPINKVIPLLGKIQAAQRVGGLIPESSVPDCVQDFFDMGQGAGELNLIRITDGNHLTASLTAKSRQTAFRNAVLKLEAGFQGELNPGRWAGKKATTVGQYTAVTEITLSTGKTFKKDQWKGGKLVLAALPGQSFPIDGNSTAGVINLPGDTTLQTLLTGLTDQTYALVLQNEGKALSVKFQNGLEKPDVEWGMIIYENGVQVKEFLNLSSDPNSARYFEKIVNDDSGNYWVKATDQFTGTITADVRPANFSGLSKTLTATILTRSISELQIASLTSGLASFDEVLGAEVLKDKITLEVTAAGVRPAGALTFAGNPVDGDTLTLDFSPLEDVTGTKVITFKTAVVDAAAQVLIGATLTDTRNNLLTFLQAMAYAASRFMYASVSTDGISVTGYDANTLLNAGTEFTESASNFTFTQVTGGVDQTWSYASENQPDLPAVSVVTGKAFAAPNAYLMGGTLHSTSSANFGVGDTIEIYTDPFPVNGLVGGYLIPDAAQRRIKFEIASNTANSVTVKSGSDMTVDANVGNKFIVEAAVEFTGGYDGVAEITDQHYIDAWDVSLSKFNTLYGKDKGLVKLGTPGVTATAVQKAGAAYAESRNYQYRYECPANIVTEEAAEAYFNDTLGRNDFVVTSFPSFGYVVDPQGDGGLKLISQMGAIHGREALVAKNYEGFHKAAAGIDVTLPRVIKLPTGDAVLNEEFLNPQGINVIKFISGNACLWGDRTLSIDPAHKWKHARETLSHYGNVLRENFDFIIFALNNQDAETSVETPLQVYFVGEFTKGALFSPSGDFANACRIKVDGENNTLLTRSQGDLNAQVTVRIVDTVERFKITIGKAGIFEELAS